MMLGILDQKKELMTLIGNQIKLKGYKHYVTESEKFVVKETFCSY